MAIILFLLSATAITLILSLFFRDEEYTWPVGIGIVGSLILSANSFDQVCRDGWLSKSIGRQGACSWHGGVTSNLNDFGVSVIIVSLILIFLISVYYFVKNRKKIKK